jgi:ribosomal protein S6
MINMLLYFLMNTENSLNIDTTEFHRYYFFTIILQNSVGEDAAAPLIQKMFEAMKDLCHVEDVKMSGKKKFTYPIKKQDSGIYCTVVIKLTENDNLKVSLDEIQRRIKSNQQVLRFLFIRHDFNNINIVPDNLLHMKTYMDKNIDKEGKNR